MSVTGTAVLRVGRVVAAAAAVLAVATPAQITPD
jgi:hypothetical protein